MRWCNNQMSLVAPQFSLRRFGLLLKYTLMLQMQNGKKLFKFIFMQVKKKVTEW
jgi:hypothetical protein